MFNVGLTGGIGSGKSTVAKQLKSLGVTVVDADALAHALTQPGTPAFLRIAEHFGPTIVTPEGTLDRGALRSIIFNSPKEKTWLEALLHPIIDAKMRAFAKHSHPPYALFVIPLLAEVGVPDYLHHVIVVDVDPAVQLARVEQRDTHSAAKAADIIRAQAAREARLAIADDVLINNGSLESLATQVNALHQKLTRISRSR